MSEERDIADRLAEIAKALEFGGIHEACKSGAHEIASLRAKLESARKALNEIFRNSNEKWIVDLALVARNQIALTDEKST